jgi:DNA-directed RNA polymerase subunit RPC12/RpoP
MEQTVKCPNCGSENRAGQQFCGTCGTKFVMEVQQQKVKCTNCGTQNAAGQQFCGTCGAKLAVVAQQVPAVPIQEVPTRVVTPIAPRPQVDVKPTWGLAWGLWWRMVVLGLLIGGIVYLIVVIVMVLAFNYKLPFGS